MTRPPVRIRLDPQPDAKTLDLIERIEDSGVRWVEESCEAFAARLEAWRADTTGTLPEPHEDDLVEDRSDCDFEGLRIADYAALLLELLPGSRHGYHHGLPATRPTRSRPGSEEKIGVMRARILRGEELTHHLDNKRK